MGSYYSNASSVIILPNGVDNVYEDSIIFDRRKKHWCRWTQRVWTVPELSLAKNAMVICCLRKEQGQRVRSITTVDLKKQLFPIEINHHFPLKDNKEIIMIDVEGYCGVVELKASGYLDGESDSHDIEYDDASALTQRLLKFSRERNQDINQWIHQIVRRDCKVEADRVHAMLPILNMNLAFVNTSNDLNGVLAIVFERANIHVLVQLMLATRTSSDKSQEQEETRGDKSQEQEETRGDESQEQEETRGDKSQEQEETRGDESQEQEETRGDKSQEQEETRGDKSEEQEETRGDKSQEQERRGEESQEQEETKGEGSEEHEETRGDESQEQEERRGDKSQEQEETEGEGLEEQEETRGAESQEREEARAESMTFYPMLKMTKQAKGEGEMLVHIEKEIHLDDGISKSFDKSKGLELKDVIITKLVRVQRYIYEGDEDINEDGIPRYEEDDIFGNIPYTLEHFPFPCCIGKCDIGDVKLVRLGTIGVSSADEWRMRGMMALAKIKIEILGTIGVSSVDELRMREMIALAKDKIETFVCCLACSTRGEFLEKVGVLFIEEGIFNSIPSSKGTIILR